MGLTFNGKTPESITIGGKAVASLSINGDVVWPEQVQETFLTFIAKEAGSQIEWVSQDVVYIYYSQDKEHWTSFDSGDVLTASSVGDKFYFYGYNPEGENFVFEINDSGGNPAHFSTPTGSWDIAGKLTSLIDIDAPELESEWNCTFYGLFMDCNIVSAKNLILPSVLTYGYTDFATVGCLADLFLNCTYLNEITTYYDTWDTSHTDEWVLGVAQTGNFYNLGGATIPRGSSGIPQSWTVHTS